MKLLRYAALIALTLILVSSFTEAKQRRQPRRRQKNKPFRLPSLFGRPKSKPDMDRGESKRVYYYSVPFTTVKPRIILGEELDFTSLGINSAQKKQNPQKQSPSHVSSLSTLEHDLFDEDIRIPQPIPPGRYPPHPHHRGPRRKRPRSRGPGYRINGDRPWREQVIEDNYRPQKDNHGYAVMPYLVKAGQNLAGAYRAALFNSAKVAKFTGHTASKYFKGVRNLITSSNPNYDRIDSRKEPPAQASNSLTSTDAPEVLEIDLDELAGDEANPTVLPKVYLDWGGSFWRFFYNKSQNMPPPEKKKE